MLNNKLLKTSTSIIVEILLRIIRVLPEVHHHCIQENAIYIESRLERNAKSFVTMDNVVSRCGKMSSNQDWLFCFVLYHGGDIFASMLARRTFRFV